MNQEPNSLPCVGQRGKRDSKSLESEARLFQFLAEFSCQPEGQMLVSPLYRKGIQDAEKVRKLQEFLRITQLAVKERGSPFYPMWRWREPVGGRVGREAWLAHLKPFNYVLVKYKCLL